MFANKSTSQNSAALGHFWIFVVFLLASFLLVMALFSRGSAAGARAKVLDEGRQDFQENSVACHGSDATGSGKLGERLIEPPKDLTEISSRNGGAYPFWKIFEIISGEKQVEGHETFQMPQYSKRMRGDDFAPGYQPTHVRILSLTHYLESIQKEHDGADIP